MELGVPFHMAGAWAGKASFLTQLLREFPITFESHRTKQPLVRVGHRHPDDLGISQAIYVFAPGPLAAIERLNFGYGPAV